MSGSIAAARPSPAVPSLRTGRRPIRLAAAAAAVVLGVSALGTPAAFAADAVGLGTAESFAILAYSGITNTGSTTVTGDIGSSPTPSAPGVDQITLIGVDHADDDVTDGAKVDLTTAYVDAAGRNPASAIAVELGGLTLLPGVYTSPTFGLTGTLTLDAAGDPNAVFVFQAGSTITTATDSAVLLINAASPCRVVWQIGSSATFGTRTDFVGDVLADVSITANTEATFIGRLLARTGAVTLDTNTISNAACYTPAAAPVVDSPPNIAPTTTAPATTTTVPATTTTTAPTATTTVPATTTTVAGPATATTLPVRPSAGSVTPGLVAGFTPGNVTGAGSGPTPADIPGGPTFGAPSQPGPGTPAPGAPFAPPTLARTGGGIFGLVATSGALLGLGLISSIAGRRRLRGVPSS